MNTETQEKPVVDLTQFSPEQLKEALAKIDAKKDQDRETYKQLVLETVPKAMFKLCTASEVISNAKTETFKFFENILDLKNQVYGLKEKQQSHTFSTDREEIQIGYRINDGWDDTVTVGVEMVKTALSTYSKDEESAILVDTIFDLLKKDAKGNLKASRVLELQKMAKKIQVPLLTDGVSVIVAAWKPVRSSWFIEANLINEDGSKTPVPLSMSSVGFSGAYKFDFFSEVIPQVDATE